MDFGWGGIERRKDEYNWGDYDELTASLEKRGLQAIYILDYSNGLYEDEIVIYRVITQDPPAARVFLANLKEYLKRQFQQREILIVEREVGLL